jgi:YbbR domain-containing protein
VYLTGEASELAGIDTVYTSPVFLSDQKSDQVKTISLIIPGDHIALSTTNVQLQINVGKLVESEMSVPVKTENAEKNFSYSLFPSKIKVKYSGVFGESGADTSLIRVFVDLAKANNNKLNVNMKVLSDQITVLGFEPKQIEFLKIKK